MSRSMLLTIPLAVSAALAACTRPAPYAAIPRLSPPPPGARELSVAAVPAKLPTIVRRPAARDGSVVLLADVDGRTVAYIADEDDALVRVLDVDDGREISRASPGGVPAQLVMLPDGRLVASLRDTSELVVLVGGGTETSRLVVERRVAVPTEPIGLALSPDDATLVVASAWGSIVTVLDAATMTKKSDLAVAREPRSVVVSSDGKRAFVSHAVGERLDVVSLDGAKAKPISLAGKEEIVSRGGSFDVDRAACQGFAIARADDGRVFAPHVLVATGDPSFTSSGYGGSEGREPEVFHVPVIDEIAATTVAGSTRLRDGMETGGARCALPRAAVVGKAGLFVTCVGADVVTLLDARATNPHDVEIGRWAVPSGPVGIALDEAKDRAVVWSQFAHALTTIALPSPDAAVRPLALSSVTLPRAVRPSAKVERGRVLFHATDDRRISTDGRACASCHPEGRDDTLVWSSPKGPRQTPMLAGRLEGAAPFGWNGDAKDVSTHLLSTVKRLGGKGLEGEDKEALMAYVASMRPPPERRITDGAQRESIARGRAIFASDATGCASCHGGTGDLPDGAQHDVKSWAPGDTKSAFDTPSLRFVGRSAPYFHDGRYKDLTTLLVKSDGKMGHTKHLSKTELADLTAYLESL